MKNKKEAQRIFDEALKFLWNCLISANKLPSSTVNTVLNALFNHVKKLEEKLKLVDLCAKEFEKGNAGTQHFILLNQILSSLNVRSSIILISSSEYDKTIDRIYNLIPNFSVALVQEFIKRSSSSAIEDHFIYEQIYGTRLELIVQVIFKGKNQPDGEIAFNELLRYLLSSKEHKVLLEKLLAQIENEQLINKENALIFFNLLQKEPPIVEISQTTNSIVRVFKKLFIRLNIESGALKPSYTQRYLAIGKKEKFVYLDILWSICATKSFSDDVRNAFLELLLSCYFRDTRIFNGEDSRKAWGEFVLAAKHRIRNVVY